jgi:uncharacterized peroxidase-related enzyme
MSRIKVISYETSTGRLREIYDHLIATRGQLAEVHKIQSLRPESIIKHMDLYMEIMFSRSLLSRAERELIAVVVSVANACAYCAAHHGAALLHYWKDSQKLQLLEQDYRKADLSERELLLCTYAETLTKEPGSDALDKTVKEMKLTGLTDEAILDATLVVAYFNFANRMVMGLGVELEANKGLGYKY